ncbi:MAG: hypothetical protein IT424_16180 [Pirellulales bacterium]|nr:hypothetical protein [Pirellulales bacterium]
MRSISRPAQAVVLATCGTLVAIGVALAQSPGLLVDWAVAGGNPEPSTGGAFSLAGGVVSIEGEVSGGAYALAGSYWGAAVNPTSASTPTATTPVPAATTPASTPTAIARVEPTPGTMQVVSLPVSGGTLTIPGEAAGGIPLDVFARPAPTPTGVPSGVSVLAAVEISFVTTGGAVIHTLDRDVTIELSSAGLGLQDDQIDRLVIFNASRNEFLPTRLDRSRQVAIATTRRFSVFTIAVVTAPIPRGYLPLTATGGLGP